MFIKKSEVEEKLKEIGYGKEFSVVFQKKDGTEREVKQAIMDEPKKAINPDSPVPIRDVFAGKWSSFYTDSVIELTT